MTAEPNRRPVAVVTGGGQGLGRATARRLITSGFDVVVVDLKPDEPHDLRTELLGLGTRFAYVQGDIADLDDHPRIVEDAWAAFGGVECLVDNAGIAARPLTDVLELGREAFDRSVAVNLRGTFFLTQAFANRMLAAPRTKVRGPRSIVVVTSIAADEPHVDRAQYCLTKSALSMMTKLFAVRLAAADIAVHEVRPGFIRTAMTSSAGSETIDGWIREGRVPLRRWGDPDEVGRTVATLARGDLAYSTGQTVYVAGGLEVP